MDLNEIKKLIEDDGGKVVIVEDGKPVMVITSFKDYKKKFDLKQTTPPETKPLPKELADEELKIEDLPL